MNEIDFRVEPIEMLKLGLNRCKAPSCWVCDEIRVELIRRNEE